MTTIVPIGSGPAGFLMNRLTFVDGLAQKVAHGFGGLFGTRRYGSTATLLLFLLPAGMHPHVGRMSNLRG